MTDSSHAFLPQPLNHDRAIAPFPAETLALGANSALREELHYRQLERTYHQSEQYAAMVKRYPLLQSSIDLCRSMALISDASCPSARAAADLQWERSHGEG
jgi:hypothetical protein